MKTCAAVLSYNAPEATDKLLESIKNTFSRTIPTTVLDNGSLTDKISKHTTHRIEKNIRMTRGFNLALSILKKEYEDYDNFWLFTNDCYFMPNDLCPLTSCEKYIKKYPDIGILHPSESASVEVCFDVKNNPEIKGVKLVVEYDFVCPIFTKKCLNLLDWRFSDDLYLGWGLDYESSFIARKNGLSVGINHEIVIGHNTSYTYDNNLDELYKNRNSFYFEAKSQMKEYFNKKYGASWHNLFSTTYAESYGRILSA